MIFKQNHPEGINQYLRCRPGGFSIYDSDANTIVPSQNSMQSAVLICFL